MKSNLLKRSKNIWVPLSGNFCTPFASWIINPSVLNQIIGSNLRFQILPHIVDCDYINGKNDLGNIALLNLIAAKLQSFNSPEIFSWLISTSHKYETLEYCYPFLDERVAEFVGPMSIKFLLDLPRQLSSQTNQKVIDEIVKATLVTYQEKVSNLIPFASLPYLLLEAKKRSIPAMRHTNLPTYQLGYGKYLTLISKGYTGNTGKLATNIATSKYSAAELMQRAVLPVPRHYIVKDFEHLKKAAAIIKFPLVVKPNSTDKGLGVTANISSDAELKVAWLKASPYGSVLVEEMIDGFDHRLHVINGICTYVVKRVPPHIIGDGVANVSQLINRYITNRRLNPEYRNYQSVKSTDPLILEYLSSQGYMLDSIPDNGQLIYLRSNANVSTGGFADEVTQECHPDNILLAEKAARIIGLDNAGVDFITTDISISWKDSGGKITEVNPTPAFGKPRAYSALFDYLYPNKGNGQIPIILLVGAASSFRAYLDIIIETQQIHKSSHAFIVDKKLYLATNESTMSVTGENTQNLINAILVDKIVEVAIIQITMEELKHGLNLPYIDLIIATENIDATYKFEMAQISSSKSLLNPSIREFQLAFESLLPNVR